MWGPPPHKYITHRFFIFIFFKKIPPKNADRLRFALVACLVHDLTVALDRFSAVDPPQNVIALVLLEGMNGFVTQGTEVVLFAQHFGNQGLGETTGQICVANFLENDRVDEFQKFALKSSIAPRALQDLVDFPAEELRLEFVREMGQMAVNTSIFLDEGHGARNDGRYDHGVILDTVQESGFVDVLVLGLANALN